MEIAVGVVLVIAVFVGIIVYKDYKEKNRSANGESTSPSGEKLNAYTKMKPSKKVIYIGIGILVVSILVGAIFAIAVGSEDKNYIPAAVGVGIGLLIEGLVIFGVLYGIGHILKNNEEMNEKMDKMIEIEMWKKENK